MAAGDPKEVCDPVCQGGSGRKTCLLWFCADEGPSRESAFQELGASVTMWCPGLLVKS
jgi:hypothetical protein